MPVCSCTQIYQNTREYAAAGACERALALSLPPQSTAMPQTAPTPFSRAKRAARVAFASDSSTTRKGATQELSHSRETQPRGTRNP
jgi:hypothetical protein